MNRVIKEFVSAAQLVLIALICFSVVQAQPGAVDPAFNPGLLTQKTSFPPTNVSRLVAQPDGKILVAGYFRAAGKIATDGIARLNADGTVDATFRAPAILSSDFSHGFGGKVFAVAVQADGKILIGGDFTTVGGASRPGVARLNADGSLDASFNHLSVGGATFTGTVLDLKIVADGRILIAGSFSYSFGSGVRRNLVRLNADGTPDAAFVAPAAVSNQGDTVWRVEELNGGKLIISGAFAGAINGNGNGFVNRLNADGSLDNSFATVVSANSNVGTPAVAALRIQPDGKILIGGGFGTINGFPLKGIARLNADGTIDGGFNLNGAGVNGFVFDIEIAANGKILVGGSIGSYNNIARSTVFSVNADGSLDNSMAYSGDNRQARDLLVLPDGKLLIGSDAGEGNFRITPALLRVNADGTIDQSFRTLVGDAGRSNKVLVQPDGKILVGGFFTDVDNQPRFSLVRLNADGTLDGNFVQQLSALEVLGLDARADGKILVASSGGLRRLNANGAQELSVNTGLSYDAKFLPGGGFVAVVNAQNLRKYTETGVFVSSFNVAANAVIRKIVLQPDGKIIVVGDFTQIGGATRGRVARINADGTIDQTFNPPGGANNVIFDAALQADGKIVVVGIFPAINFNQNYKYLARLNSDGSLDTTFNPIVEGGVQSLRIQPDGKILVGGAIYTINGVPRAGIARLNADGTLDGTFSPGAGANNSVLSIDLEAGGNIIIGGTFTRVNNLDRLGVARLLNAPTAPRTAFDFDGDGKADLSVFRPSNGAWYLQQSQNGFAGQLFGQAGDRIAPGDYDGDGKTDLAVYRGGIWYLQRSALGFIGIALGAADDLPVPADYDADGKTDVAVWRPSNGTWYRINSSSGLATTIPFGQAGDKPTLGDFDGNGAADIAVFRPSNGVWYRINAQGQQVGTQFGQAGDLVVPADYDGDGKTDLAVYRGGIWYLQRSSLGFTGVTFGDGNDKPVPADYDGDGKADIAVYRPSSGVWYLLRTTQGLTGAAFGAAEDAPIPNAFVR